MFARCIETVAELTGGAGFSVVKVTALGRPQLLLRISEALQNYANFFRLLTGTQNDQQLVGAKLTQNVFIRRLDELGLSVRISAYEYLNDFENVYVFTSLFHTVHQNVFEIGCILSYLFNVILYPIQTRISSN